VEGLSTPLTVPSTEVPLRVLVLPVKDTQVVLLLLSITLGKVEAAAELVPSVPLVPPVTADRAGLA
jgi:hypothetical protein